MLMKTAFLYLFVFITFLIPRSFGQVDSVASHDFTEPDVIQEQTGKIDTAKLSRKYAVSADAHQYKIKRHDPTVAACLSIIPGVGQMYNKKWWKLPIVYGALGTSGFFVYYYGSRTIRLRTEYIYRQKDPPQYRYADYSEMLTENVRASKEFNQRNMEIAIGATIIIYILNIIDACVDSHLYHFDVSDNLALSIQPQLMPAISNNSLYPALGFTLKIK